MISLGVASWLFDAWRGVFYPEALPRTQYLAYYARRFRTVQVNSSFYGQPRPTTVDNWLQTTPDGFTFCLKLPQAISHEKRLVDCEAETLSFLDLLRKLGNRAAPALLQLPPSLSRQRDGRALADYLAWIAGRLDGLRLAVEVRSPDLMTPAFAAYVAGLGIGLTLVDRVGTADLFDAWLALVEQGNAPDFALIRWIGDDKDGPVGDREITSPRDADLDRWTRRLAILDGLDVDVFGYMHNPYEGHSPASVHRLEERLRAVVDLPAWTPPPIESQSAQMSLFE
jgi:uncharacterized protein YecE (DUF72 family)